MNDPNTLRQPVATGTDFTPPSDGFIHVMPFGDYSVTRNDPATGQPITFRLKVDGSSAKAQIDAFNAARDGSGDAWAGMLVDFDHGSMDADKSTEAAGWATALESRDDGIWAKIRWTDAGLSAIKGGRFRFTSPVHLPKDLDGQITSGAELRPLRLYNLALTNIPRMLHGDFPMQPISSRAEPEKTKKGNTMDHKAMLFSMLGLGDDATDEQVESALKCTKQTLEAVEGAKKVVDGLKCRVTELEGDLAGRKADEALTALEKDGYAITSRDDVRAMLIADHDRTLKAVRAIKPTAEKSTAPGASEPIRSRGQVPRNGIEPNRRKAQDAAVDAIQKEKGIRSRADAVQAAIVANPELFK